MKTNSGPGTARTSGIDFHVRVSFYPRFRRPDRVGSDLARTDRTRRRDLDGFYAFAGVPRLEPQRRITPSSPAVTVIHPRSLLDGDADHQISVDSARPSIPLRVSEVNGSIPERTSSTGDESPFVPRRGARSYPIRSRRAFTNPPVETEPEPCRRTRRCSGSDAVGWRARTVTSTPWSRSRTWVPRRGHTGPE